ncbi:DNRLRE domain-containing protein, partial [Haloplasma contractile]
MKQERGVSNNPTELAKVPIKHEIIEKRDAYSKTFRKLDGTYEVSLYDNMVHYSDHGVWKNIDNSLSLNEHGSIYKNIASKFKVHLPKILQENKKINIQYDNYQIDFKMLGVQSSEGQILNPNSDNKNPRAVKNHSSVLYSNIYENVDLKLHLVGEKLKEDIIIHEYKKDIKFTYIIGSKQLEPRVTNNGIEFFDSDGKSQFIIDKYYMFDASENFSYDIDLKLQKIKKGEYQLIVKPSEEWLSNAQYPVIVDPTISSNGTDMIESRYMYDTYISESAPSTNYSTSTYMPVGNSSSGARYRSLLKFSLPISLEDKVITYSTLELSKSVKNEGQQIDLHINKSYFDVHDVNWDTSPDYDSTIVDYHIIGLEDKYIFDITKATQQWLSDEKPNYGFTIKSRHEYGAYNSVKTFEYSTSSSRPLVKIGYSDRSGLKDYWTYQSQGLGLGGTGYVTDYTGILTMVRNEYASSNELMNFNLDFIYNSDNHNSNIGFGNGWRTNYNIDLNYNSNNDFYSVTTGDGSKTYYASRSCYELTGQSLTDTSCYIAEDGSGNILKNKNGNVTIETKDKIVYNFGNDTSLDYIDNKKTYQNIQVTYTGNKIKQIYDEANNKIEFIYNSSGNLERTIYSLRQPDYSYNIVEKTNYYFDSTTGNLDYIRHYYDYNNDSLINLNVVNYDFNSNNIRVTDNTTGNSVKYDFDTRDRVESIYKSNGTYKYGHVIVNYDFHKTVYTDHKNNSVRYLFDNYGHTINILDDHGTALFYRYINPFTNDTSTEDEVFEDNTDIGDTLIDNVPNYFNNHKLLEKSLPQKSQLNPVENHSFERHYNEYLEWKESIAFTSVGDIGIESTENLYGKHSVYIKRNSGYSGYELKLKQDIELDKGNYTISGFIKNSGSLDNSKGAYIDIVGASTKGVITHISGKDEWQKYELGFTIDNDNTPITIVLENYSISKAYFDNIQINEGFIDARYNLIDNASFENYYEAWTSKGSSGIYRATNSTTENSIYNEILGDYSILIDGSPNTEKSMSQTIISPYIGSYNTIVVGGWAKANAAAPNKVVNNTDDGRVFEIRVTVAWYNSTDTKNTSNFTLPFNPNLVDWQYQMSHLVIDEDVNNIKEIEYVTIEVVYQGTGTVYYDGIQAYIEEFGTSYTYESNGNIGTINTPTSTKDIEIHYKSEDPNVIERIIDSEGQTTNIYSTNGLIDLMERNNVKQEFKYNGKKQTTEIISGDVNAKYFSSKIDYTSDYVYKQRITNEFDESVSFKYDRLTGLLESSTDQDNLQTIYDYDNYGRLVKISKDSSDNIYKYIDNKLDKIITNGTTYQLNYNSLGQLNNIYIDNNKLISYDYLIESDDVSGENYYTDLIKKQTYTNGDYIYFDYNNEYQLEKVKFNGESDEHIRFEYEYDQHGNVTIYNDVYNNQTYFYHYDLTGRLRKIEDRVGNTIGYEYDGIGNFKNFTYEINGKTQTTSYKYDDSNNRYQGLSYDGVSTEFFYKNDAIERLSHIELVTGNATITKTFTYDDSSVVNGNATKRIKAINYDGIDDGYGFIYQYDNKGNIVSKIATKKVEKTEETELCFIDPYGEEQCSINTTTYMDDEYQYKFLYDYDGLNQMIREDYKDYKYSSNSYTKVFEYDNYANLLSKKKYSYQPTVTISSLSGEPEVNSYSYTSSWKDQLTSYDGTNIYYDDDRLSGDIPDGNPDYIGPVDSSQFGIDVGSSATVEMYLNWEGRQLEGLEFYTSEGITHGNYKYNDQGYRTQKVIGNETTTYYLNGDKVIYETNGTDEIYYTYDVDGTLVSMNLNGIEYFYVRNIQGDIVKLVDKNANIMVEYTYDAWGNILETKDYSNVNLSEKNPYRYRGYRFDEETGWYYLNSRY